MERRSNPAKAALHRFHLDGQSLAPPSRVTTAPTSDKSGHHFHHHPHRHRHHRDKSQPQSAIQLHAPGGLFPENAPSKVPSRSNGVTPVQSAAGSRRGSLAAGKEDLKEVPSQIVLEKAKEQRGLRDEELRISLQSLSTLSMETTRRLDDTYYNLLQTLGTLVSTITSLRELFRSTTQLHQEFEHEANELEEDIETQLESFNDFETKQNRIAALQGRMQQRKQKLEELGTRLEAVRTRVADWERREGEWQAKITRRLRLFWAGIGILVLLFVALQIFQRWPAQYGNDGVPLLQNRTLIIDRLREMGDTDARNRPTIAPVLRTSSTASSSIEKELEQAEWLHPDSDPRLRVFDEL